MGGMPGGGMGGPMGNPMGFPMGGPEIMQMMQSPFFQQAMDSLVQNPQMFRSIVESVPALRPMLVGLTLSPNNSLSMPSGRSSSLDCSVCVTNALVFPFLFCVVRFTSKVWGL